MLIYLGSILLCIVVIFIILLVLDIKTDDKNDGTLLNTYLPNGKKKIKKSNAKLYILAALVCLMLVAIYLII